MFPKCRIQSLLPLMLCLCFLSTGNPALSQSQTRSQRNAKKSVGTGIQRFSSRNFRLITDLEEEEAKELLRRLETMLKHVTAYFGRRNPKPIDMFVAKKIDDWPAETLARMDPHGIRQIRMGAGVTISQALVSGGRTVDSQAVVYAVAKHGTPQHEAVHAYCTLAFGSTGPVWYSEGMAEVGNYWRDKSKSVNASPYVIQYLKNSKPKLLDDIVNNPLETTGDSWQNYAWRWALCHLLGHNENYTKRFKPLGLALLNRQDIDFWQVYGSQAKEIAFEYRFFLKHIEPGYRVDLCSWDWKARFRKPRKTGTLTKVKAQRGWQASKVFVEKGRSYFFRTSGEWAVDKEHKDVTADGLDDGRGRLVACIFHDYELSEEIELGAQGSFLAPMDGQLFLRCRDGWGSLEDNSGIIDCRIGRDSASKEGSPR